MGEQVQPRIALPPRICKLCNERPVLKTRDCEYDICAVCLWKSITGPVEDITEDYSLEDYSWEWEEDGLDD